MSFGPLIKSRRLIDQSRGTSLPCSQMASALEKQAHDAFIDEDFETAVDLFSQAFEADPKNGSLLISRAQAHIKLGNYTDAVADSNKAIELNPTLSKAYMRKGVACFSLEEYETAKTAFVAGAQMEPSNTQFKTWIKKCEDALVEEAANESQPLEDTISARTPSLNEPNGLPSVNASTDYGVVNPIPAAEKPTPKYRHDFYQNVNEVIIEIFVKGLKSENVEVDFGVQLLSVVITIPPEDPYVFHIRLNQKVVMEKCKYQILSTKLEIRLAKAEPLQWKMLEYNGNVATLPSKALAANVVQAKSYPSSSKKGHKDWDKLEAQVKIEEKDEKLEGDAAVNKLFRTIYQDADEDTRRAMNKSFVESNGTVLSTNWKEVGSKHVDGSPPSGMEIKKW